MRIVSLLSDEEAVSPVIGVILMVAITVILAAVIGTFVLGLGDQLQNDAPQASFTFDFDQNASITDDDADLINTSSYGDLTVAHDGGDIIPAERLAVDDDDGASKPGTALWSGDVSAGDTSVVEVDTDDVVRVTWTAESGGTSATLGKFAGPDA